MFLNNTQNDFGLIANTSTLIMIQHFIGMVTKIQGHYTSNVHTINQFYTYTWTYINLVICVEWYMTASKINIFYDSNEKNKINSQEKNDFIWTAKWTVDGTTLDFFKSHTVHQTCSTVQSFIDVYITGRL